MVDLRDMFHFHDRHDGARGSMNCDGDYRTGWHLDGVHDGVGLPWLYALEYYELMNWREAVVSYQALFLGSSLPYSY